MSESGISHDVQLADIETKDELHSALRHLRLEFESGYALSKGWIPRETQYRIIAPERVIKAEYLRTVPNDESMVGYLRNGAFAFRARHKELIESQASPVTEGGESGSPVIDDNGVLLGMHIGGSPSGKCYMIPAWELFDSSCYGNRIGWIDLEKRVTEDDLAV